MRATADRDACAHEAREELEEELTILNDRTKSLLDPAAVDRAQAEFLAYVEAQCDLEGLQFEGGSGAPVTEGFCIVTLMEERVARLQMMNDFLDSVRSGA